MGGKVQYCYRNIGNYPISLFKYNSSPAWQGQGYYRFMSPGGTKMPESTPGKYHCGTAAPGWLRGEHPVERGLEVDMTVCFDSSFWGDCNFKTEITVTNCGDFYVYNLNDLNCYERYCAI